jgi:hypothetical protein
MLVSAAASSSLICWIAAERAAFVSVWIGRVDLP